MTADALPSCPTPIVRPERITAGHGSGGRMMQDLIAGVFAPAFGMAGASADGAVLPPVDGRIVATTDTFVVRPLFFPGGDIGSLAVHGTVNDLAVMGARPLYLTVGFVLEEGFPIADLERVVASCAAAATEAGVRVVAGDTKVVERGHGDGVYVNTSGIGVLTGDTLACEPSRLAIGDVLIVNGPLGDHGIAVMSARDRLGLEGEILSDSAALNGLTAAMLGAVDSVHVMRDLTRGGLSAALCELAAGAQAGIEVEERDVPVRPAVAGACEILGMDPMETANEGKLVAAVPEPEAERLLATMQSHPLGREAAIVGRVVGGHPGTVVGRTTIGGERVIDTPVGALLPRIC